jgi:phospholipid/cholesterol/gamma-HCH transport system substrate-binding protein
MAGIGVFVFGGLVLFAIGLFMIGDRQMAFAKKFTVYTEFNKITGLQPGGVVRVSGAKAGTITQILPPATPDEKFRVRLELTEELHQLVRTDSVATIETEGLVGGSYLGIGTGTGAARPVSPNATIAGREPFEISDLMTQMGDTIQKVNNTVDAMQGDVARAVAGIANTADTADTLLTAVAPDLKQMAASGAKVTTDISTMAEGIRSGKGAIGKLVTDDELYTRLIGLAAKADTIAADTGKVIANAKNALDGFQSKDGPVQGMTASVVQTMDDARAAMAGLAENMDAMKHNFLLRGFFKGRGYYELAQIAPADYRKGVLLKDSDRQLVRVWQRSDVLFEPQPDRPDDERLSDGGKAAINAAIAPYLESVASGIVMVEGYSQQGKADQQYLRSRSRASLVRDYLIANFHLDPQATGAMALSGDSFDSPGKVPWDGVAVAVILPKGARAPAPISAPATR